MNRSAIFTQYNKARAAARQGKLDPKAVNKALGLCQSKSERPYITTTKSCSCPAYQFGGGKACKHMIVEMIKVRIAQAQPEPTIDPAAVLMDDKTWTAEQVSGGYYIHNFAFDFEAIEFIQAHPEIQWVRPTNATGRRLHPDRNH